MYKIRVSNLKLRNNIIPNIKSTDVYLNKQKFGSLVIKKCNMVKRQQFDIKLTPKKIKHKLIIKQVKMLIDESSEALQNKCEEQKNKVFDSRINGISMREYNRSHSGNKTCREISFRMKHFPPLSSFSFFCPQAVACERRAIFGRTQEDTCNKLYYVVLYKTPSLSSLLRRFLLLYL